MSDENWTNVTSSAMPSFNLEELERIVDEMAPARKMDIRVHPDDRHLLVAFLEKAIGAKSAITAPSVLGSLLGAPITETEFQERGKASVLYYRRRKANRKGILPEFADQFSNWSDWKLECVDVIVLYGGEEDAGSDTAGDGAASG